eukprot:31104-Pelagococcus_subviridis.AAC.2
MLLFARQNVTSFLNASASKIMCRNDTHPQHPLQLVAVLLPGRAHRALHLEVLLHLQHQLPLPRAQRRDGQRQVDRRDGLVDRHEVVPQQPKLVHEDDGVVISRVVRGGRVPGLEPHVLSHLLREAHSRERERGELVHDGDRDVRLEVRRPAAAV